MVRCGRLKYILLRLFRLMIISSLGGYSELNPKTLRNLKNTATTFYAIAVFAGVKSTNLEHHRIDLLDRLRGGA
jgi:hypothetical protein